MGLKSGRGDINYDEDDEEDVDQEQQGDQEELDQADSSSTEAAGDRDLPYVMRRMMRDKGIQFERDDRLTFFVHSDVARAESQVVSTLEGELGRDIPVMDVREAAYRYALEHPDEILQELVEMGYRRD